MSKIDKYILKSFIKYFAIVVSSCSVIIAIVVVSQQILGMPDITKFDACILVLATILGMNNVLMPFYVSIAVSMLIMELGRTSQFTVIWSSGVGIIRIIKPVLFFAAILGLLHIFLIRSLEVKLGENAQIIIQRSNAKKPVKINIKDQDLSGNYIIINANYEAYKQDEKHKQVVLSDAVITRKKSNIFEVISADRAYFSDNQIWSLSDVAILNNDTKTVLYKKDISFVGSVPYAGILKQIDAAVKVVVGDIKQYGIYSLLNIVLFYKNNTNEARSSLKVQLFKIITMPIILIISVLIVPLLISRKAITRNGLKMNAIFLPQCAMGLVIYFINVANKIALGAMKYEVVMCLLPSFGALVLIILLYNNKKLI